MRKYFNKKEDFRKWQNNLKIYFGLLFYLSVSSAAAKTQMRFVTAFNFMEEFWKTIIPGKIIFLKLPSCT